MFTLDDEAILPLPDWYMIVVSDRWLEHLQTYLLIGWRYFRRLLFQRPLFALSCLGQPLKHTVSMFAYGFNPGG
jgi:hypothetical protein